MKKTHNTYFLLKNQLQESIKTIPKENKAKFAQDLLTLIDKAHNDDYKSYSLDHV